jgi:hypothetical protein
MMSTEFQDLSRIAHYISSRLRILGFTSPRESVVRVLLDTAYFATLRTEEGRFVRGSLTFSDPSVPDINPPICRRADYPAFASFRHWLPLRVDAIVKLSRAIDSWSGSIAVYGTKKANVMIWGVVDQLVGSNIRLHREAFGGFTRPGVLTVTMDGVGALSVYHGDLLLCALRQNDFVTRENDALRSRMVTDRVLPAFTRPASQIALALSDTGESSALLKLLFDEWVNAIARICIGLRRAGTGGSLLLTPTPLSGMLDIVHRLPYRRLGDSAILKVLDDQYLGKTQRQLHDLMSTGTVSTEVVGELSLAQADAEDREKELTGAVKIVTSLAAADGLVLLDPLLVVAGFGVKIKSGGSVGTVYDAREFVRKGTGATKIDLSRFGTRHGSMLRYCRADRKAIGIVVSQDGHVRLIASAGRSLALWENVKLLRRECDVRAYAIQSRRVQRYRDGQREDVVLGYTSMPKTIQELLAYRGVRTRGRDERTGLVGGSG